tara:strand:+ start:1498 stop:1647 length:150 start_codon:yes stop_codon:yes gene_type:complete
VFKKDYRILCFCFYSRVGGLGGGELGGLGGLGGGELGGLGVGGIDAEST